MKILHLNSYGDFSTGKIIASICKELKKNNNEGMIFYAKGNADPTTQGIKISNTITTYFDALMTRLTDKAGFFSFSSTKRIIKEIDKYNPDIIHLHNLHGYYLNIELLFNYLKTLNKPVVWTLHDCWPFTGHCPYYVYAKCDRWKSECHDCPQQKLYPKSFVDNSRRNFIRKKQLFNSVKDLNIVCVSNWLSQQVENSFLANKKRYVIHNGIDTDVYKPTASNFREENNLKDKFIVFSACSGWNNIAKGLSDIIKLSHMLSDEYVLVVAGVDEFSSFKENTICMPVIADANKLVELYSCADVFINPSYQETFGLTTIEAMSCGTPSVVYNVTALPEVMSGYDELIVEAGNIEQVLKCIQNIRNYPYESQNLREYIIKQYNSQRMAQEYLDLYKELLDNRQVI